MKQSKKIRRVAAVLAAVAVLCSSTTSLRCADAAVSEGDLDALQQEQQELEQQREKLEQQQEATKAKLDQLRADKSKQQEYKATLDSQMQNVQSQINVLNQQVSTLDTSIQEKTAQLSGKQQEVNTTFDELKKRLCAIYKTGEASTLQILLSSQNVMDLANKTYLLRSITEHDVALINGLKEEMQGIAAEKAEIEQNRADLTEAKSTLDQKRTELGALQSEAQNVLDGIANQEQGILAESDALSMEEEEIHRRENEAGDRIDQWWADYYAEQKRQQEELKRQQEEEQRKQQEQAQQNQEESESSTQPVEEPEQESSAPPVVNDAPLEYVGGQFTWPVPGYTHISCGYSSDHKAIDINRTNGNSIDGAPIVAANSGKVVKAGWDNSYGNFVMIDHGGGYSTLYAHASSLAVGTGQQVERGQTIAYVGSTGDSTGPHLHFEVRVDGVRQNPFNWFSAG